MKHKRLALFALFFAIPLYAHAQGRGGRGAGGAQPAVSPQAAAPIDLTGYWVSLVTDNWTYRVITPPKGDYLYLPLNAEARRIADTWDPAKDEAAGEQCKGYGPVGVMRMPTAPPHHLANRQHPKVEHRYRHADTAASFRYGRSSDGTSHMARLFYCRVAVPRYGPRARRPRRNLQNGHFEGHHHPNATWIYSQKWRSVQRKCGADRILHNCGG